MDRKFSIYNEKLNGTFIQWTLFKYLCFFTLPQKLSERLSTKTFLLFIWPNFSAKINWLKSYQLLIYECWSCDWNIKK